jgi:hypothetical protein
MAYMGVGHCLECGYNAEANPCQCFSCDPDGTRYICQCDWIDEDDFVLYDEEVVRNLEKMIPLIKSMKTVFDHVRGDVEAREIMVDTINRAIEIIRSK